MRQHLRSRRPAFRALAALGLAAVLVLSNAAVYLVFEGGDRHHLPLVPLRSLSIKRMIGNLINNARRYGQEPIWLSASLSQQKLRLIVRDHGSGIRIEDAETLMQPFVRGESARTTQGSGLGLAIVKRIVRLHQGEVSMRNHPDGGLEVTVEIPIPATAATSEIKRKSAS